MKKRIGLTLGLSLFAGAFLAGSPSPDPQKKPNEESEKKAHKGGKKGKESKGTKSTTPPPK